MTAIKHLPIDRDYLVNTLRSLIGIPSPTGYTDRAVIQTCRELEALKIPYELTRRGAIRGNLVGLRNTADRALIAHVDTLGAMVKNLKPNGRLALTSIGHWSARFAEGARATIFTDNGEFRGTILPLKASGHTFNEEVDSLPVGWDYVELRVDAEVGGPEDLERLGMNVGDFVAIDPNFEMDPTGYINSRHLDDKAGVAVILAAAHAVREAGITLPIDCHLLFTISEETGSGASAVLHGDVCEMVTVDNGTVAPGQNSREKGVTFAMKDQEGPFDYHLTHYLIDLARRHGIPHQRDVFRYYRCDSASAIEAGNDIRTALVTFGIDASHGYERVHIDALVRLAELLVLYMQTSLVSERDREELAPLQGFPEAQGAFEDGPLERAKQKARRRG